MAEMVREEFMTTRVRTDELRLIVRAAALADRPTATWAREQLVQAARRVMYRETERKRRERAGERVCELVEQLAVKTP